MDKVEERKPRELTVAFAEGCEPVAYDRVLDPKEITDPGNWEYIHVIEYQAYENALKSLREEWKRLALDAANCSCCQGNADILQQGLARIDAILGGRE
jgi:hypothetical protein